MKILQLKFDFDEFLISFVPINGLKKKEILKIKKNTIYRFLKTINFPDFDLLNFKNSNILLILQTCVILFPDFSCPCYNPVHKKDN